MTQLRDTTGSIAVVVTPLDLLANMESMVYELTSTEGMLVTGSHLFQLYSNEIPFPQLVHAAVT